MYSLRFFFEMSAGTILFLLLGAGFLIVNGDNITKFEKIVRNKIAGLIIALPALAACVPHAQIVAPGILQSPFILWPLAIAIPVLCYFYIDYYTARAAAGAIIVLAYDLIHYAYDERLPGAAIMTIAAWLFGFAAIWASGKPHALRDWFRKAADNPIFARTAAIFSFCSGICFIAAIIGWIMR